MSPTPRRLAELVSQRVHELRVARQWSQAELARRVTEAGARMHQTTVARIETGSRPASLDDLQVLADTLGVTPAMLIGGSQGARELAASNVLAARGRLDDARAEVGRLTRETVNARGRVVMLERELQEAQRALEVHGLLVVDDEGLTSAAAIAALLGGTGVVNFQAADDVEPRPTP